MAYRRGNRACRLLLGAVRRSDGMALAPGFSLERSGLAEFCLIENILRQRNAESAEPSYADLVTEQLADRAVEVMRGLGISRPGPIAVVLREERGRPLI
jgi:hypothetical protein